VSTSVSCKYFDKAGDYCNHEDRRWFFGRYRRRCSIVCGGACRYKETSAERAIDFADATMHGQCVDTDGNEWEVSAVTSTDIVVTVRGTDGRSSQTHIPKDPFLRRLVRSDLVDIRQDC